MQLNKNGYAEFGRVPVRIEDGQLVSLSHSSNAFRRTSLKLGQSTRGPQDNALSLLGLKFASEKARFRDRRPRSSEDIRSNA
jgi:hypothetical protein